MCSSQRIRRLMLTPTPKWCHKQYRGHKQCQQKVSPEGVTAVAVELGVSPPADGGVSYNERDCMRQVSHILQKVISFNSK